MALVPDYWQPLQAHSLGSKMKPGDLHLVYNPVSALLKLFDSKGHLLRQYFAHGRADSRGLYEPKANVGRAVLYCGYPDGAGPTARIEWEPLADDKKLQAYFGKECPFERWYFVRTDYQPTSTDQGVLSCHMWEMDPGTFVDLYQYLINASLGGTIAYFEICGRHMIRSDIFNAMTAPAH